MDKINQILVDAKNLLITSHLTPDPDAICSSLGMYDYITRTFPNISVRCLLTGNKLTAYNNLKNYNKIEWVSELTDNLQSFDTIVFVDASELSRFTDFTHKLDLTKYKTICIDHHKNQTANFNFSIIESDEPSASQIIYKYFFKDSNLLEPQIAEVFLTGILSDTGMLKFVRPDAISTFDYVKDLIRISNIDIGIIEQKYFTFSLSDWDIIQELTKNIVKVNDFKYPFIYSYLPIEYLNKYSLNLIKQGKSKFLILFGISIEGYKWSFIATPYSKNSMNLSFRSAPDNVNVRLVANQFNGGGHDLASGGEVEIMEGEESDQVSKRVVEKIKTINFDTFKM